MAPLGSGPLPQEAAGYMPLRAYGNSQILRFSECLNAYIVHGLHTSTLRAGLLLSPYHFVSGTWTRSTSAIVLIFVIRSADALSDLTKSQCACKITISHSYDHALIRRRYILLHSTIR